MQSYAHKKTHQRSSLDHKCFQALYLSMLKSLSMNTRVLELREQSWHMKQRRCKDRDPHTWYLEEEVILFLKSNTCATRISNLEGEVPPLKPISLFIRSYCFLQPGQRLSASRILLWQKRHSRNPHEQGRKLESVISKSSQQIGREEGWDVIFCHAKVIVPFPQCQCFEILED